MAAAYYENANSERRQTEIASNFQSLREMGQCKADGSRVTLEESTTTAKQKHSNGEQRSQTKALEWRTEETNKSIRMEKRQTIKQKHLNAEQSVKQKHLNGEHTVKQKHSNGEQTVKQKHSNGEKGSELC